MTPSPTEQTEVEPLTLLHDLQGELTDALNSLGGKRPQLIGDRYHLNAAAYINKASEGFLLLRTNGRADASKLLIRPAIEAVFRVQALRKKPELLYHIAWTERLEDKKWFRSAAHRHGSQYDENADDPSWKIFEEAYKAEFPQASLIPKKLTVFATAEAAGLEDYYGSHYRMYCQYTHAALRATGGHLDELSDAEDTRTMILCAYCALAAIAAIGALSSNLQRLHQRVEDLSKREPLKLLRQIIG